MSQSKENPVALMSATVPNPLPVGYTLGIDVQLAVMPRRNVMVVPADKLRTAADGSTEVLVEEPDKPAEWRRPPAPIELWPLGKQLPPDKCDLVAMLNTVVEDTMAPKLVDLVTRKPKGHFSGGPLGELARVPLDKWQAAHMGALRGPVE